MRILLAGVICAAVLVPASRSWAQSEDWSGYYVGTAATQTGVRNSDISATVDPFRDSRFRYTTSAIEGGREPRSSRFESEFAIDATSALDVRGGKLFATNKWVWGAEVQVSSGSLDGALRIGPVDADPLGFGPGGELSYIFGTEDTLSASLDLKRQASVRARVGRSIGDRLLLSAFAGPTIVQGHLRLRQDSVVDYAAIRFTQFFRPFTVVYPVEASVSAEERDTLSGGVVGGALDLKLTDHWRVYAEASVSQYEAIEVKTPAYGGTGSQFSYKPELYTVGLGLAYRF